MFSEIRDKEKWMSILNEIGTYDFYHTYDYHTISKEQDEAPTLLYFKSNNAIIALPLILRSIPDTPYFDVTSVYGYAGPLFSNECTSSDITLFQKELVQYFESKQVISVFSRLHPYIKQDDILKNLGYIEDLGEVVNIDLTLPLDQSRMAYSKSNKNQINKLRRSCEIVKATNEEEILAFVEIYYENMKRLNAEEHYFFSKEYFLNFMKVIDFKTDMLLVRENESGEYIAGSMFVKTNSIVQFHLSGTKTDYLYLKPSKLFLDEMRIIAKEQGYKFFNLGGGLGSERDSLFDFKASFSKDFRSFKVWKYIVNQRIYDELSESKPETSFFPKYRY